MQRDHVYDAARAKAFFDDKVAFTTGPVELEHMIKSGDDIMVVDVREGDDYAKEHIPGAINIPRETWENPRGLQKQKTHIVYCYTQTCHLAAKACAVFVRKGYQVMEMEGGYAAWKSNEFEVERAPIDRMRTTGERIIQRRQ